MTPKRHTVDPGPSGDVSAAEACAAYRREYRAVRLAGRKPRADAQPTSNGLPTPTPQTEVSENGQVKFAGVSRHQHFDRSRFKWTARIKVRQKSVHLGDYDTPELAAAAYQGAKRLVEAMVTKK